MEKTRQTAGSDEPGYRYKYPHPAVTTDCVIFGFDGTKLRVLLIRRGAEPYKGRWAFPGGFLNMDESAEEGALRELREETGLDWTSGAAEKSAGASEGTAAAGRTAGASEGNGTAAGGPAGAGRIRQLHTFSEPGRDPRERVVTIAYYALVRLQEVRGGDDAAEARWFTLDETPALAFDHDLILRTAVDELRHKIHFEPVGFELLPEKFTVKQLQNLYEAILGVRFDRRNFYSKMLRLGILDRLDERAKPAAGREALLFSFNPVKYAELKDRGFRSEF